MWWATRLTFHSQRILRHLTRLQLADGDYVSSKKTLLLYVQLLTKGRQTSAGDVSLQLKRRPTDLPAEHPEVIADEEDVSDDERGAGEDSDDDPTFLRMLLLGVRMLCRYGDEDDVAEAKRLISIARDVIGEATGEEERSVDSSRGAAPPSRWSSTARSSFLTSRGILSARLVDFGGFLLNP